jgi:hypothetical protein
VVFDLVEQVVVVRVELAEDVVVEVPVEKVLALPGLEEVVAVVDGLMAVMMRFGVDREEGRKK